MNTLQSLSDRIDKLESLAYPTLVEEKKWTIQSIPAKTLEWGECSEEEMTWDEAVKWCEEREGRLPTVTELYQAYWDKVEGFTQSDSYWSSTSYPSSKSYAMYVYFGNGYASGNGKTSSNYVRCVRELI